ncbi:MAG: hypothetical protein Q4A64_04120 [Porphyromonadaceae bacterium]|nr:hypothetical protein [Porphyromonadaceae bacterium]
MDKIIKVLVLAAVIALGYLTFMSVYTPVQFDKIQQQREEVLQKKLKKIATYQDAFEDVHHRFATADELVAFLESGKLYYVMAEGDYTDAMREQGLTEADAAAKGLIRRDTIWVSAKDSLVKDNTDITRLYSLPVGSAQIQVDTAFISQIIGLDTVLVPVFEARVPFSDYLSDQDKSRLMDKERMAKEKAKGYPGLRIGSLTEVKMTGNWE